MNMRDTLKNAARTLALVILVAFVLFLLHPEVVRFFEKNFSFFFETPDLPLFMALLVAIGVIGYLMARVLLWQRTRKAPRMPKQPTHHACKPTKATRSNLLIFLNERSPLPPR